MSINFDQYNIMDGSTNSKIDLTGIINTKAIE